MASHTSKKYLIETMGAGVALFDYDNDGRLDIHFGLGAEIVAAAIEIRWPSGIRQTLKNVRADQILQIDEPSGSVVGKKTFGAVK